MWPTWGSPTSEAWNWQWPTSARSAASTWTSVLATTTCALSDGAQAAAQTIVADEDVIGVVGPTCSTAAVAAAPLVTAAGMVLIAPSNTSPTLTSDLAGNPGLNHSVGYYRTSNNGLFVGEAMARFVHSGLELASAAAIHDGDPYSRSIAQAFADSFERLGGTVTGFSALNKEDTDMVPVLTEVATGNPDALFFRSSSPPPTS